MYSKEGTCDWCNKVTYVKSHRYVDGKANDSCKECNELAKFDVRAFNIAEMQAQANVTESRV